MRKRIESDLLLKILSVVFAFLLWMFVINTDNPVIKKTFSDVPVDMLNEQVLDELNQTYKIESGDTVSFTVKGKKDIVDRLTKSDFRATADVSSMSDVHAIPIKVEALRYKSQLDVDTGNATVKVVLEDVKSDQIPVVVEVKGAFRSSAATFSFADGILIGCKPFIDVFLSLLPLVRQVPHNTAPSALPPRAVRLH